MALLVVYVIKWDEPCLYCGETPVRSEIIPIYHRSFQRNAAQRFVEDFQWKDLLVCVLVGFNVTVHVF